ncbi:MAG: endolytic transglycosylase MltG [Bacteroidales bacterium]|nr:endolytic transglycosylase MltG [Bacteroidales bacterium]
MTLFNPFRKSVLKVFLLVALLAVLAVGGAAFMCLNATTANAEPVRINLPTSDEADAARNALVSSGLVDDDPLFGLIAAALKLDKGWREGSYVVQPHTPVHRLIKRITRGQQDPIRLTIGKFRLPQQLEAYLDEKLMHNDFSIPLDSLHLILPDTYELYWTISPDHFMQRMRKEYDAFWRAESGERRTEKEALGKREVIVLASIVEEETNYGPEKGTIASVYLNRLRRGMPLQADPTVKYALGDFALRRILNTHLKTDSPFNTYLHTGLPPAPICTPSKASIRAVINAPETPYIYFCANEKMDGTHRFASSLAEHNRNAAAFHAALNRKGIR